MKADFFRMLFHKAEDGIYYTAAMRDEIREETLHLAYVAQGAAPQKEEDYPLDILVAGDSEECTCERICRICEQHEVSQVILPRGCSEQLLEECQKHSAQTVVVDDFHRIEKNRWELRFQVVPGVKGDTLVMYQGFLGDDLKKEDCAFAAKIVREAPCVSCIYGEDDYCGFACLGKKDFEVLKGHKRPGSESYRMGTLILGSMCMKGHMEKLDQLLAGTDGRIRCVCLPLGLTEDNYERDFMENICNTEDYVYALGSRKGVETAAVGSVILGNPYVQYRTLDARTGFCASGYRIPYTTATAQKQ